MQHAVHSPGANPALLPGHFLQFPSWSISPKDITAIFVPMDEACTALTAGPKVRDSVIKITNTRRTTLNDIEKRY